MVSYISAGVIDLGLESKLGGRALCNFVGRWGAFGWVSRGLATCNRIGQMPDTNC